MIIGINKINGNSFCPVDFNVGDIAVIGRFKYNNLVTLMLGKNQIVLMMFVLGVRIITAFLTGLVTTYLLRWRD